MIFVILSDNLDYLQGLISTINIFLANDLKLSLHPYKISIRRYSQGVDFLGYVSFSNFRILRTKTKNRIIRKLGDIGSPTISKQTIQSYLGILKHCNGYKIKRNNFNKFLGMIYFIFGEDSYRSKRKLEEIISGYKKVHKSGLNLIYVDAKLEDFKDFYSNFKINSMFAEKKLIVLKNIFADKKFQEEILENIEALEKIKDIVVIYEDCVADQRIKIYKSLQKYAKCQEFNCLSPALLKKWIAEEFSVQAEPASGREKTRIDPEAIDLLISFVKNDLWQMANEINKLSNYKSGGVVKKEDVELLVKPNAENDIFKTIDALASKNKKLALDLLHKQLDGGDVPLYLLSMIAYQFRNLLTIKELQTNQPYGMIAKKSGLHPFVVQKTSYVCNQFTIEQLKKIYQKIFKVDSDIKTGKIEPETALDLLLAEI